MVLEIGGVHSLDHELDLDWWIGLLDSHLTTKSHLPEHI